MRAKSVDWINVAKYGILLLLIIYIVGLVKEEGTNTVPIATIEEKMLEQISVEGMAKATGQDLKKYYGLNASDYDGVCLYIPDDVMSVSEVLVVKVKDKSQIERIESAMKHRLDTQKTSFEGYGAEQTKLIKSAIVKTKGYYVLLAVSPEAELIENIFLGCIS